MDDNEQKNLPPNEDEATKQAAFAIVKPVRTYERDIAESIRETNASVASINVAEQKRKEERKHAGAIEETEKFAWGSVATLTSIVVIFAVAGILGFLFFAQKNKTTNVVAPQYSIISTDQVKKIDVTGVDREKLIKLLSESLKNGGAQSSIDHPLTEIKLVEKVGAKAETSTVARERQISSDQFMSLLALNAPSPLSRAFGGPWIFGFYSGDFAEPFILANLSSFDNAFDGMIRWEKDMANDVGKIFFRPEQVIGTTTKNVSPNNFKNSFEDLVIKSKNVRVLRDNRDNTILLYSFLSDKYIVITTNENVFKEVLNRFLASKLVR